MLSLSELDEDVLFINAKKAFSIKYLQYHEELVFRGHLSSRAVSHAYRLVHADSDSDIVQDFHKYHTTAMFYHMAVRELEPLKLHMEIVLDDELKDHHLEHKGHEEHEGNEEHEGHEVRDLGQFCKKKTEELEAEKRWTLTVPHSLILYVEICYVYIYIRTT